MPMFNDWRQQELRRLRQESGELFDRLCDALGLPPDSFSPARRSGPTVRFFDNPGRLVVEISSFALDPEDIHLTLKDNVLLVEVVQEQRSASAAGDMLITRKRYSRQTVSRIPLPFRVHAEGAEAVLQDGVLRVFMPKCTQGVQHHIPVRGA